MNCDEVDRIERALENNMEATNALRYSVLALMNNFAEMGKDLNSTVMSSLEKSSGEKCCCSCDQNSSQNKLFSSGKVNEGNCDLTGTEDVPVKIVSWAEGSYDEINAMLDAHYAGKIDITNYWAVGDIRVEYMSEIPENNGFEHHAGHDIELIMVGFNTYIPLSRRVNTVTIMVKDGLNTMGSMDAELFSKYTREDWLNSEFINSLPIELGSKIKRVYNVPGCVFLPSFNEMVQLMDTDPELFKHTFINAWTRDTILDVYGRTMTISSWIDSDFNLHKSYSLPFDQRNIVPMFCL